VRERLAWPLSIPAEQRWNFLPFGVGRAAVRGRLDVGRFVAFRFTGRAAPDGICVAQTLISAFEPGVQAPLWIGLRGRDQRLTLTLAPEPRRSPQYWIGPAFLPGEAFDFQLLIHAGMGPGGVLFRTAADARWSSLETASAWGAERLEFPACWSIGHGQGGAGDRMFEGASLAVSVTLG
jgi:hypothetical protein